jgi:hypothetical protein
VSQIRPASIHRKSVREGDGPGQSARAKQNQTLYRAIQAANTPPQGGWSPFEASVNKAGQPMDASQPKRQKPKNAGPVVPLA